MKKARETLVCFPCAVALAVLVPLADGRAEAGSVGLSSVRAQRFDGVLPPSLPARPEDRFAFGLAVGDFDGNGTDDLATGVPFHDGPDGLFLPDAGAVLVRRSASGTGLSAPVVIVRQVSGFEMGDEHGYALASCDFNGDGFDDLAVGAPGEDIGQLEDAGAVFLYLGSSGGLNPSFFALYTQDTPGIPETAETEDLFGYALACGDFDGDGFDDLLVGAPGENTGTIPGAGMVFGIAGSIGGLDPDQSFAFSHGQSRDVSAQLGFSLAAGDWNGDGFDDLAAGEPFEQNGQGALQVRFGTPGGISGTGGLYLTEASLGGAAAVGDAFAYALAAGDFDGDGHDDLAVGTPGQDCGAGGTAQSCGQANVLYGGNGGFDLARGQIWSQDTILGLGTSESFDRFGLALAAGDFDHDGLDDLAIGAPDEFVTGSLDGAATVIMGSSIGLTNARRRGFAAGFDGLPGDPAQHGRRFSFALASGDFDGDEHADLAIGSPFEDLGSIMDAGTETILYGSLFSDGFETGDTRFWSAAVP